VWERRRKEEALRVVVKGVGKAMKDGGEKERKRAWRRLGGNRTMGEFIYWLEREGK